MLTLPNLNPASCNARLAVPSAWPTKLGITYTAGDAVRLISKLVRGAATPLAFGGGLCASTWSAAVPGNWISATEVTSNPRRRMFHSAARSLSFVTSGIATR